MADENPVCPTCGGETEYERDAPKQTTWTGDKVRVALAAGLYRCPDHGLWRIDIAGQSKKWPEQG